MMALSLLLLLLLLLAAAPSVAVSTPPQLFMDLETDLVSPWGLLQPKPTALVANASLSRPPANYSAGATVIASFGVLGSPGEYEVFVAVGRPGEPLLLLPRREEGGSSDDKPPPPPAPPGGIAVERFTTSDFVRYSPPVTVLYLPNNSPEQSQVATGDGGIWTVKSMDRNEQGYLLMAFYGDSCSAFAAPLALGGHSFTTKLKGGVFKDHDDTNLIWSRASKQWVDMQIMGSPWLLPNGTRTTCPHNLSDNGGCKGGPRTVTIRTSSDGSAWSGDWGCAQPPRDAKFDPAVRSHCEVWNESGLIRPHPTEDPPELQFYRIRPFYLGESGRYAAHTLQYAASPAEVNNVSDYGYWGPYCPGPDGRGFIMCHKGHGYGKMHGPHVPSQILMKMTEIFHTHLFFRNKQIFLKVSMRLFECACSAYTAGHGGVVGQRRHSHRPGGPPRLAPPLQTLPRCPA